MVTTPAVQLEQRGTRTRTLSLPLRRDARTALSQPRQTLLVDISLRGMWHGMQMKKSVVAVFEVMGAGGDSNRETGQIAIA